MVTETYSSTLKFKEEENPRRLKLLHLQLKALHLSGILPPASALSNRWKSTLYDFFTAVSLLWFPPSIAIQIVALCQRLDEIEATTAILFQVSCYISTGIISFYFVWKRQELVKLFDTLEAGFVSHMDKVGSPKRRKSILEEAAKKSAVITWVLLGWCFAVETAWGGVPFIIGYVEYFTDAEPRNLTNDRGRYFGLTMWLPENVNQSPTYELMHVFHFMSVYTIVSNLTGSFMIMFAFAFHTTTQFKILCAAFEDMDEFEQKIQNPEYVTINERRTEWISTKVKTEGFNTEDLDCDNVPGSVSTNTLLEQNSHSQTSPSSGQPDTVGYNRRYISISLTYPHDFIESEAAKSEKHLKEPHGEIPSSATTSRTPVTTEPSEKLQQQYLMECIRFHQTLIGFSTAMNNFLSPVVLIFFVSSEAMMCLSTFQLALGQADARSFKFFTSVILACIWPLVICMYGDDLIEQSAAVKDAAFGCRWYNRAPSFNKLLRIVIMRAHKPVVLTAGKFYIVSLATFADIGNKVYAYFTLLKRMNEE